MIEIRLLKPGDYKRAKTFRDLICELIGEGTYLIINRKPTMKEEKEWLKERIVANRKQKEALLTAWDGKRLVGCCEARKGKWKDERNVSVGICILKKYRRQGLGKRLLRGVIQLAKKRLAARIIYLEVAAPNKAAISLYKKCGFGPFARFPKWSRHNGRYIDNIYMMLKK